MRPGGHTRIMTLAALALTAGACGDREPTGKEPSLTPGQFIEVIVELREAEWAAEREAPADSVAADFQRRKDAILERHGVSEEGLRRFMERNHGRPGLMSALWDSIAHRLRTAPPEESDERYEFEQGW